MSQVDNRQKGSGRNYSSQNGNRRGTAGTSQRTGQSYRSGGSYQQRRGKRRKRGPQYDITKILLAIILVIAAAMSVMAAVKIIGGRTEEAKANATTVSETDLQKEVKVDGISITGLSKEKAKELLDKQYNWGMKVTYNDEEYELENLADDKVDEILDKIYAGEPEESYTIDFGGMDEEVKAEVEKISEKWDVAATNGSISGFDKDTGKFTYSGEQNGVSINQEKLTSDILSKLSEKDFQAVIEAQGTEVAPEITEAQAKEMYEVIGTYTTTTTANSDRNKNIELASDALNGLILQPGEEFSFNETTGERSSEKGYRPAGAYLNGELIEEPGGGVCQVSSTLYNAVVFSGLTTTERHAHSYEPSYVTPGEDAMVSYGGPDMKFVNNSSTAIAIRASFADRKLKISIIGIPILEDGVTLSMTSTKTAELDAPEPVFEEDQTLQPDEEKVVKEATKGSRWVTNLVTKKDGTVVSDEFFHNSTYRGKSATIKRNTSGVVVPTTDAAGSSEGTVTGSDQNSVTETSSQVNETAQETTAATTAPAETDGPSVTTEAGTETVQNVVPPNPLSE